MRSRRVWLTIVGFALALAMLGGMLLASAQQANRVEVGLTEWSIVMPEELPAGPTVLEITNTGRVAHNLRVAGEGVDEALPVNLRPGQTATLELDLAPGTYEFTCPVANHVELGMVLEVSVAAAAGQAGTGTPTTPMGAMTATRATTGTPEATRTMPPSGTATPRMTETPAGLATPGASAGGLGWGAEAVATPGGELPFEVPELALVQVAEGLTDPISVAMAPDGTDRLFVVERNGIVRIVEDGELLEEPFLDISDITLAAFLEQGLYDIEFHPDYATNGRFYVHFAELLRNGDSVIVEYTVSDEDPNVADPDSARLIMIIEQPWANHNGGELAFGPEDGLLYIGSGDGGWEGDPLETGQNINDTLGAILRIDVDATGQGRMYGIPEDNPFAQPAGLVQLFGIMEEEFAGIHSHAAPEIYYYGLRNPWRFHFDTETGDLWLPDVGQNIWEEINYVPAGSPAGLNFGWDINMGTHCFPSDLEDCPTVGVLPAAEYNHDLGCAVIGLGVYHGSAMPEMDGAYLVGDFCSGRIWAIIADGTEFAMAEVLDTALGITGGGPGPDGEIYVTTCQCSYGSGIPEQNPPGTLWRIAPASEAGGAPTAPTGEAPETTTPAATTPPPGGTMTPGTTGTPGVTGTPAAPTTGTPSPAAGG